MPDVYAHITEMEPAIVERVAAAMELRAADAQQKSILHSYLSDVSFPPDARVLDVGCGTGAIARELARWPNVGEVLGVDPSAIMLDRARELSAGVERLLFQQGDARALALDPASFDVVVFHTVLCHVPEPEKALEEAFRVLRPQGSVVIFDGDYATTTVGLSPSDPLQTCVDAFLPAYVNDCWLVRRLPAMLKAAGFSAVTTRSHGYVETSAAAYMLSIVDRGADTLQATGTIDSNTADVLKAEARQRVEAGAFFGFIAYASMVARKPVA